MIAAHPEPLQHRISVLEENPTVRLSCDASARSHNVMLYAVIQNMMVLAAWTISD